MVTLKYCPNVDMMAGQELSLIIARKRVVHDCQIWCKRISEVLTVYQKDWPISASASHFLSSFCFPPITLHSSSSFLDLRLPDSVSRISSLPAAQPVSIALPSAHHRPSPPTAAPTAHQHHHAPHQSSHSSHPLGQRKTNVAQATDFSVRNRDQQLFLPSLDIGDHPLRALHRLPCRSL